MEFRDVMFLTCVCVYAMMFVYRHKKKESVCLNFKKQSLEKKVMLVDPLQDGFLNCNLSRFLQEAA